MKFPRFPFFLFAALLILLAEKHACAQWKNVAPNLVTKPLSATNGGIILNYNGILWACNDDAWISNDTGKTWSLRTPFSGSNHSWIMDMSVYDALTEVVSTAAWSGGAKIFITYDQGLTWQDISPLNSYSISGICFAGSAKNIIAGSNGGVIYVTTDGGINWQSNNIDVCVFSVRAGKGGTAYAIAGNKTGTGKLYKTTDAGLSWIQTPGQYDWDSYSFERDLCDTNTFYISNEEVVAPVDQLSSIYVSHDQGASWILNSPHSLPYYCGCHAISPSAIFAQTYTNIERSTDQGSTWKIIGGPPNVRDTRLVTAFNDNIIFAVDNDGSIWATFNSGGDSLTFSPNGSLSIAPKSVFDLDTIHCNDSILHSISINPVGCNPPSISTWSITGKDSSSYKIWNLTYDSLHITFAPKTSGDHSASLILTLTDGSQDTISLKGYNNSKPFSFTASPQTLFRSDTLYICDPQKTEKFILNTGGCLPKIISQNITGKNATDYGVISQIGTPLLNLDSVILSFKPVDGGSRNASYEITFDNGTKISIPLQGYGFAPHPLSLATTDQATDTIGGSIYVPITINGLDHAEDVELVLHYDKELRYHGSSLSNVQFDMPSESWRGRSKLHIAQAKPNTILGYARFDVFNDSLAKSHVTFDSVTVLTAIAPCQYILPASVTSTITPPSGCGIQTVSRFMNDGTMPQLSIIPNPTSGEISITSTQNVGDVSIAIYDMLGIKQSMSSAVLQRNNPAKIMLPAANGVYNVRVRSAERTYDLRVVVSK